MGLSIKTVLVLFCVILGTLQVSYGGTNTESLAGTGEIINSPPRIVAINLDDVILDAPNDASTRLTIQVEDLNGADTLDSASFQIIDPYNNKVSEGDFLILNSSTTSAYYIGDFELESAAPIGTYKAIVTAQDINDGFNISEKSFEVTSKSFLEFSSSQTENTELDENSDMYVISKNQYNIYNQFNIMNQEITQINQNIQNIQCKINVIYILFTLTLFNSIFSITNKIKTKIAIYRSKK